MARLVKMKDKKPLIVRREEIDEDDPWWICRCGLSDDWPWCDDSHHRTRDEEDGKLYRYHRPARGEELVREEIEAEGTEANDPRPD